MNGCKEMDDFAEMRAERKQPEQGKSHARGERPARGNRTKQWYRLDNAALIFPAIIRRNWNNVFRVSAELTETIEPEILNRAIADLRPRFPTFFVRLRSGFFWYYLESAAETPRACPDYAYPLTHMSRKQLRTCCIRILYFQNRIAVEYFHSVTDGTGGLRFMENLVARYLTLRDETAAERTGEGETALAAEEAAAEAARTAEQTAVKQTETEAAQTTEQTAAKTAAAPLSGPILDLSEPPRAEETRDCFLLCGAAGTVSRRESNAYRLSGTPEADGFRHIVTGIVPTGTLQEKAKAQGVTVTAYLAAVMGEAVATLQRERRSERRQKPIKITIPVNLRKVFGMDTLRNFTLAVNIGFDPRLGSYSHEQLCRLMYHQLAAEVIPQRMAGMVSTNVNLQRNLILRLTPLALKRIAMRLVYAVSGERKGCLNISNMGRVEMPPEMAERIRRIDFVIGVQYSYPNNCSVVSWQGRTYINMIRSIREAELERVFFSRLVELGIPVEIESNARRVETDGPRERRG